MKNWILHESNYILFWKRQSKYKYSGESKKKDTKIGAQRVFTAVKIIYFTLTRKLQTIIHFFSPMEYATSRVIPSVNYEIYVLCICRYTSSNKCSSQWSTLQERAYGFFFFLIFIFCFYIKIFFLYFAGEVKVVSVIPELVSF